MSVSRRAVFALLVLLGTPGFAAQPATCDAPVETLLRRLAIEVPGQTRVMRVLDIPRDIEVLVEAYENHINSRLELRDRDADVGTAESPLHRWPPVRLVIPKGPARSVEVTVVGIERQHGSVDLRVSRLASPDRRCVDFWHAMASGDAAYSRGAMILRSEIEAPAGASTQTYDAAVTAYARAAQAVGSGGFAEAQAHLVRAAALMNGAERFQDAIEVASVAEARFKALGNEFGADLARYHWAYSITYDAMRIKDAAEARRKFELAGRAFQEIAADHERRGEHFEQALALDGLACTEGFLVDYAAAIADYQRVLDLFEKIQELDRELSIRTNLAYFEAQFGRYQESLSHSLDIVADNAGVSDPVAYLANLRNAAFLELKLGKYDAALRHYSDAYERTRHRQLPGEEAWALYGLGNVYYAIGNFGEARSYLERSLELRSAQQRTRDLGVTLRTLANVLRDTGSLREAIARREEAVNNTFIPLEKARFTLELIDDRIAAGDIAIAKSLLAPLLAARDLPEPAVRAGATLASARLALAEGDFAKAVRDARGAAEYFRAHELVSSEFTALSLQARASCAARDRDAAVDLAEAALQRAEDIRTFSSNPTLRASLWRPMRPAFGFAIGLFARAKSCGSRIPPDPLAGLAIAEASRGRALEDFQARSTSVASGSKANERRREMFERLAGIRQQLETLSTTTSADDERSRALINEAARLRREIDLTGGLPESARRRPVDLRAALRSRIDSIPKDTAVVEYWIDKEDAFAWLLTRGRVQLVDLGPAKPIDEAARRMNAAMRSWVTGSVDDRVRRARELHSLIIAPLPAELARARTLYFVPDGTLHAIPFAALADGSAAAPRFLIEAHDIAVAPAFLALTYDSAPRNSRSSSALVVVDPVYARDDPRLSQVDEPRSARSDAAVTLRGSRTWTRLPGTAHEAATISRLLGPDAVQVLSGFDANRDSLLDRDLSRYDILHLATHAVADTEAPQLSALVLSTVDARGRPRVGEVFAGDLADRRLDAHLVVLSGCETALGRAEAGEGLLGLRYAAHASGAHAVVASLWPVEDAAGARLMDDLYADVIDRRESPIAALSRAARTARVRWKDPALWAAFDISVAGGP